MTKYESQFVINILAVIILFSKMNNISNVLMFNEQFFRSCKKLHINYSRQSQNDMHLLSNEPINIFVSLMKEHVKTIQSKLLSH